VVRLRTSVGSSRQKPWQDFLVWPLARRHGRISTSGHERTASYGFAMGEWYLHVQKT
jgi:hypothetical protein